MANEEYCKRLERGVAELEKENAELRVQLGKKLESYGVEVRYKTGFH